MGVQLVGTHLWMQGVKRTIGVAAVARGERRGRWLGARPGGASGAGSKWGAAHQAACGTVGDQGEN